MDRNPGLASGEALQHGIEVPILGPQPPLQGLAEFQRLVAEGLRLRLDPLQVQPPPQVAAEGLLEPPISSM